MATDKDTKKLLKAIKATPGWEVRTNARQHWVVTKDGQFVTTLASTASDWRSYKNALATLRRAGLKWPR